MKLYSPLRVLVLSLVLSAASATVFAQGTFTVSGSIQNPAAKIVSISLFKNHLPANPEITSTEIKDGSYKLNGKLDKPVFAAMNYKGAILKVYIEPGDDLNVSFVDQGTNMQTSVTGKGSGNNRFYSTFTAQFAQSLNDSTVRQNLMAQSVDAWENDLFMLKKKQSEFLSNYAKKDELTPTFIQFVKNEIEYRYWSLLFVYPIIRANSSSKILTVDPLPEAMLEGLTKVKLNNEDALLSESYRGFVYYHTIYFTSKNNGFKKFNDYSTAAGQKLAYGKEKLQGDVFCNWLAQFCLDEKDHVSPFMMKSMVGALKDADKGLKYYPYVSQVCAARMAMKEERREVVAPASEFKASAAEDDLGMKDIDGKPFSLSDLKGKVVYIDFWATWCGPCRMMMPFSKQMHEKLTEKQKKQIVFLYISIDADEARWKQGIKDNGIEGVSVLSPGNWGSKVCSYFQINSIPRYMIMDKKGNIVDYNAKRPSEPAVLEELINLANQ